MYSVDRSFYWVIFGMFSLLIIQSVVIKSIWIVPTYLQTKTGTGILIHANNALNN